MKQLPEKTNILEISSDNFFKGLFPDRTTYFFTSPSRKRSKVRKLECFSLSSFFQVWKDMKDGKYSLVALGRLHAGLWDSRNSIGKNIGSFFKHLMCPSAWAPYIAVLLAKHFKVPAMVYDPSDTMLITPPNFFFFRYIRCFFKRELPQNNWHAFLYTTVKNGDVSNIRRQPFFQKALLQIRPFPLHIGPAHYDFSVITASSKKTDIFYVGDNLTTTVRSNGLKMLKTLQGMGYEVDIPEQRLPQEEFNRRLTQAWLAWSPEGSGWECHRHYEAVVHGAVPLINYPTIHRYKPFLDRVHAFYYACEEDDLVRVIREILADKPALLKMVQAARDHLETWYTSPKILSYVLENTLREEKVSGNY